MNQRLPIPVTVIVVLHLVAALLFGILALADPSLQFPDLVLNDDGEFVSSLYANRNIGMAVALLVALLLRSPFALAGLLLARFVTDLADLVVALASGSGGVVPTLVFFLVLLGSEAYALSSLIGSDAFERQLPSRKDTT